jgi:LEM3 (ligand-effect modulator 3) family / CDC50 family
LKIEKNDANILTILVASASVQPHPSGFKLEGLSNDVVELKTVYDGPNPADQLCGIGRRYNAGENCTLQFTVPLDMEPPILIHYELTNFHQNHRSYAFSRDDYQLAGQSNPYKQDEVSATKCSPLNKLGEIYLNPCGLIANTFFNDVFSLQPGSLDSNGTEIVMVEDGIAWQSDLEYRFAMPDGYEQAPCDVCDASCCEEKGFSCETPVISKKDGVCYAYNYPFKNETRYLYEIYPQVVSPLEHVTNEHFVVWMRVATRPQFRKLYGYIEQPISAGTVLSFDVNLNYVVEGFGGTKALILSTNSAIGGKNPYVGKTFYYMGFFCLFCGFVFAIKHWFRPRKLADRKYLHYKED